MVEQVGVLWFVAAVNEVGWIAWMRLCGEVRMQFRGGYAVSG